MHTNTRNLSDALEVIPCCDALNAHLIGIDWPGAGNSEGVILPSMCIDLENLMEWIKCMLGENTEIIFWARGLSTYVAMEYCAKYNSEHTKQDYPPVIYVVLDTPFESVRLMVDEYIRRLKGDGHQLPETMISICSTILRRVLATSFRGVDPYTLSPITFAASIDTPCSVIGALKDDYIPLAQSLNVAQSLSGHCCMKIVDSGHFGTRPVDLVNTITESIVHYFDSVSKGRIP
jgi:hypothetical protein